MENELKEQDIRDFLLKTDFKIESGYSYGELLEYLVNYKYIFIQIFEENRELRKRMIQRDICVNKIAEDVEYIETVVKNKNKQIENLSNVINRKLTIRERIFGKIIL